ncbi:MAG: MarR family winged helix-turn-helix transcriptional regulator [Trebonia sp.]
MAAADDATVRDATVREAAERIAGQIESIRRVLRESVWARAHDHPGALTLTAPQVHALQVIVEHMRQAGTGLSLSDLSEKMGLAHSTVSGIVGRLERDGLLRRTARPDDRRYTQIELADEARQWVQQEIPAARLGPLESALRKATGEELATILDGLAALERLLPGTPEN